MVTASAKSRTNKRFWAEACAAVFDDAPCPFLVLTPDLEIVGGNQAYLHATGRERDSLLGRHMFDAFPDNPEDPLADGVEKLGRSFEAAMRTGARDEMRIQRYDVRDRHGVWRVRYWRPANWPVLGDGGRVLALVHHVVDVTEEAQTKTPLAYGLGLLERAELACDNARRVRAEVESGLKRAARAISRR